MGEVAKGIQAIRTVKSGLQKDIGNATGLPIGGGQNYDPGLQDMGSPAAAQAPNMSQGQQPGVDPLAPLPDNSQPQQQMGPMASSMLGVQNSQPQQAPQPVDNPYAPDTPKELSTGKEDDPIEVTGDDWKPHKEGWLGGVMDVLLQMRGRHPIFKEANDSKNMQSAMQGWQKDPDTAISRMRQVDPDMAMRLQQHVANVKAKEAETIKDQNEYAKTGAEVLGAAINSINTGSGDPAQKYSQALPTLRKMVSNYHLPDDMLPESYDKGALDTMVSSSIPTYQQKRLEQYQQVLNQTRFYQNARLEDFDQSRADDARHDRATEGETNRHNLVSEERLETKAQKAPGKPYNLQTKYGIGQVDKNGNRMLLKNGDKYYLYLNGGTSDEGKTNWVPQGEVQVKP